jgi:hypothetical protein
VFGLKSNRVANNHANDLAGCVSQSWIHIGEEVVRHGRSIPLVSKKPLNRSLRCTGRVSVIPCQAKQCLGAYRIGCVTSASIDAGDGFVNRRPNCTATYVSVLYQLAVRYRDVFLNRVSSTGLVTVLKRGLTSIEIQRCECMMRSQNLRNDRLSGSGYALEYD